MLIYLDLLKNYAQRYSTEVLAYCLMLNHVHHCLVPEDAKSLAETLRATHTRYAALVNAQRGWTGHLWQQRFYSAALDNDYLWTTIRYIELNPVKAGIVASAPEYRWSSAKAHCNLQPDSLLTKNKSLNDMLSQRKNWESWLKEGEPEGRVKTLRSKTLCDLPCGSEHFVMNLEEKIGRRILPRPNGRPKKSEK